MEQVGGKGTLVEFPRARERSCGDKVEVMPKDETGELDRSRGFRGEKVMAHYTMLYYIISIILYYIVLYHIISYYIISYHIILYYIILYYIILYYIILYYIIFDMLSDMICYICMAKWGRAG